jgi:outer membrane lipoprotein-sorting protein
MKRIVLSVALSVCAMSSAQAEGELSLSEISTYLNGLTSAQAPFSQVNDDGTSSSGMLYLKRPGRMRFEYSPPESAVVVAGGNTVMIRDPKSNQPPESYPLNRTPLSIILADRVDLDRANMVVGHRFDGSFTIVTAQDPENAEYGSIDLYFADSPITLEKWVIQDGAGGRTFVELGPLKTEVTLNDTLFSTQPVRQGNDR